MNSLTVAVISDSPELREQICRELGKKSPGEEDVGFYHSKTPELILTALETARFPEKAQSLLFSLAISEFSVIAIDSITPAIGEAIVAAGLAGRPGALFSAKVYPEQMAPLVKGTPLESWEFFSDRKLLRDRITSFRPEGREGPLKAAVDHSFEVKGVGSVALGFVLRGTLNVHDKPTVFPSGKQIEVRSIQMHDDDYDSASADDRFGISFRGAAAADLSRGDVLAPAGTMRTGKELLIEPEISRFVKRPVSDGETLHAAIGLQFIPCKAFPADGKIKLVLDSPAAFETGESLLLVRLNEKALRVIGKGTII